MNLTIKIVSFSLFAITGFLIWSHNSLKEEKLILSTNARIVNYNNAVDEAVKLSEKLKLQMISKHDSTLQFKPGPIEFSFNAGNNPDQVYLEKLSSNFIKNFGKSKDLICELSFNRNYWGDSKIPPPDLFNKRALYMCRVINLSGEYRFDVEMIDSTGIKKYQIFLNTFANYLNKEGYQKRKFIGVKHSCENAKVRLHCFGGGFSDWVPYNEITGTLSTEKFQNKLLSPKRANQNYAPTLKKPYTNQYEISPKEFMEKEFKAPWCL